MVKRLAVLVAMTAAVYAPGITHAAGADTTYTCNGVPATYVGTEGRDIISTSGSPGLDVIVGLGGDDKIHSGLGEDLICGGTGNDELYAGPAADRLYGGSGDDFSLPTASRSAG